MPPPNISIVMAMFNASAHLRDSIDSILAQSYTDFELIIVDDGSADESAAIVASYSDPRIRLIAKAHAGLVASLNCGIAEAKGPLIARMDADDRAIRDRLMHQLTFLNDHPEIDILCTDVFIIDGKGNRVAEQVQSGVDSALVRDALLFRRKMKPIIHPSIMMRRTVIETLGGYREFTYAEDHDLWLRAVDTFNFARLNEKLLEYRIHDGGISRTKITEHLASSIMSVVEYSIKQETGKSLFERPTCFSESETFVRDSLQTAVIPAMMSFGEIRNLIRKRRFFDAAVRSCLALLRHHSAGWPWHANRNLLRIASTTADRSIAKLNGELNRDEV